jgi:hypothetical protein
MLMDNYPLHEQDDAMLLLVQQKEDKKLPQTQEKTLMPLFQLSNSGFSISTH